MTRTVTHVTLAFVPRSEAWLYDVVTAPLPYDARVLTAGRENAEHFPFDDLELLVPTSGVGSRVRLRLSQPLGWRRTPANSWRRPLRRLGGNPTLFHAHYGPVGWRVVDAGLSPVVTSFYGFDASETRTLEEWRVAYRRLFRRGAAFVAEGPAMRERLLALGAPPERTHAIPLIADLDDDWAPASLDAEPPLVLMAGRLVEKKGFADGIAAFSAARRTGLEARLVIIGGGPEEARLREAVRAHGIEGDVEFVPAQPRERFREIVRSSHVLLQPSLTAADGDAEGGAPITLLEAQGLGRVIVATDHADIPNVVDPTAAFLSPEGNAASLAANLAQALEATGEWAARGAAGRRFVEEHHSRGHVATLLERLYDAVAHA